MLYFCSRACSETFTRTENVGGRGTNSDSKRSKDRLKQTETRNGSVAYTFHKKLNLWFSFQAEIKNKQKPTQLLQNRKF